MYRVFLGAPLLSELPNDPSSYSWRTISSTSTGSMKSKSQSTSKIPIQLHPTQSVSNLLPLSTLEEASYRISLIYKDIVFGDELDEDSLESLCLNPEESEQYIDSDLNIVSNIPENTTNVSLEVPLIHHADVSNQDSHASQATSETKGLEVSVFRDQEQTTVITWDPTGFDDSETKDDSGGSSAALSFLLDTSSKDLSNSHLREMSQSQVRPQGDTQAAESQFVESQSLGDNSNASSIGRFPSFHFNLHSLTSLSQLAGPAGKPFKGSRKVNVLLAVLEVEGPDVIRVKKGADAGKQVGIFKMILGDEEGNVCKLTAWREVAEEWGGVGESVATKRGDIVHIENVMATCDPAASTTMTASPYLKSHLVICYRTMPYAHEDGKLRPDLRLGHSEPVVRKVAAVVRWFENMAGLPPKS